MTLVRSRMLLALDSGDSVEISLRAIAIFRDEPLTELIGLFIQDDLLLRLSRAAAVREITFDAMARPLLTERLERQFRARASRLRTIIEAAAHRAGLKSEFQVARGEWSRELLRAAHQADILVLCYPPFARIRPRSQQVPIQELIEKGPPTLVFLQPSWAEGRRIVVLLTGPESKAALELGAAIAVRERAPLCLLTVGDMPDAAWIHAVLSQGQLQAQGIERRRLECADSARLIQASRNTQARMMIVPRSTLRGDPMPVSDFLQRAECTLIIVA